MVDAPFEPESQDGRSRNDAVTRVGMIIVGVLIVVGTLVALIFIYYSSHLCDLGTCRHSTTWPVALLLLPGVALILAGAYWPRDLTRSETATRQRQTRRPPRRLDSPARLSAA